MKNILLKTSFSKIYIIVMILISLLILGGYFSYAMFTVSKERSNAISIVTGNLTYELKVDEEDINTLTVKANSRQDFIVVLTNPNNIIARFNFYYLDSLPEGVDIGYIEDDDYNIPPSEVGVNLEKVNTSGSSNKYRIRVANITDNEVTIKLGVSVGLDYNDLSLPSNGHLLRKIKSTGIVSEVLEDDIMSRLNYTDSEQTFITGEEPNNYIWYSGKLWRAVSVNNEAKTTKLVTQWNISSINYSSSNTAFEGSYMEEWLNDTTVDGFLGNLRDYENFIVTDAKWDATEDATELGSIQKPNGTTTVTVPVGLLNMYEYQESYRGTTYSNGYLSNGLRWWTLTPYSTSDVRGVVYDGNAGNYSPANAYGVRPSINLKSNVKIVDGDGTVDNPYRLNGDNDANLSGTLLSSRYSGEYIRFGTDENNLYRIVSHENGTGTKIVSEKPLKSSGEFIESAFGSNTIFSSTNTVGSFLNVNYLTSYVDSTYSNMIEESSTWYLGTVGSGASYKLAKYIDTNMSSTTEATTNTKVGLLRLGELMSGQFDRYGNNTYYWTLTPYSTSYVRSVRNTGYAYSYTPTNAYGVRPSLNLKSNVIITSGDGTKQNPFNLSVQ